MQHEALILCRTLNCSLNIIHSSVLSGSRPRRSGQEFTASRKYFPPPPPPPTHTPHTLHPHPTFSPASLQSASALFGATFSGYSQRDGAAERWGRCQLVSSAAPWDLPLDCSQSFSLRSTRGGLSGSVCQRNWSLPRSPGELTSSYNPIGS